MGKGDTDRGHSRENYDHIFRKEECGCEECVNEHRLKTILSGNSMGKSSHGLEVIDILKRQKEYAKRVTKYKGEKQNAVQEGQ